METEETGALGGPNWVTGHAQNSQLIKDAQVGLPVPGSYSVGSNSLLGEPDKGRGAAEPLSDI